MGKSDDKNSPLPTPTKPSPKLNSLVEEAKENRLTSPNPMKSSAKKNFMSPTISAASKAVAQRKKVLAERNGSEATEPTCVKFHHRRSSSFDLKQGSVGTVDMDAAADSLTDDGAKLKPYDPVLNYCSPRPKFLLYKPNRRSEILRRYEMIDCASSESETGSENEECLVKQTETENIGESVGQVDHAVEEVITQPDEEAGESVMEVEEKIEGLVEELLEKSEEVHEKIEQHHEEIQEHAQEAELVNHLSMTEQPMETTETKSEALQTMEDDGQRIQPVEIGDGGLEEDGVLEEEHEVERDWSFKRFLKLWFVIFIVGLSTLYVSSMNSGSVGLNDEYWEVHSGLHGVPLVLENASGSVIQGELAKMGFEEVSHGIMDGILVGGTDNDIAENSKYEGIHVKDVDKVVDDKIRADQVEGAEIWMELVSKEYVMGEVVGDKMIGLSTADQTEAAEDEMDLAWDENVVEVIHSVVAGETLAGDADDLVVQASVVPVEETTPEKDDVVNEFAEPQSEASDASSEVLADDHTAMTVEETAVFEDSTEEELQVGDRELEYIQSIGADNVGDDETTLSDLDEDEVSEMASNPVMVDDGYAKGCDMAAIFGVVSALLLALVGVLGFQKLEKRSTKEERGIAEEYGNRVEHQVDSNPGAEVWVGQSGVGAGAPRVELLGELQVGGSYSDNSWSFSGRNMKNMCGAVDSQAAVSGFSSTTESSPPPYGGHSSQRRSFRKELPTSSIDSPSYGSFTTEMMFRQKEEEGRGGEKIIVTPVRRSNRIHSRMTSQ